MQANEETLEQKYKQELAHFTKVDTFKEKWLLLLQDLTNASESIWDYTSIRYDTVMTQKEWKEFVENPERTPYQSKVFGTDVTNKNFKRVIEIIKDAYAFYESQEDSKYKSNLKSGIAGLLDAYINAKYNIEVLRLTDTLMGRTAEDRDNGIIEPTPVSIAMLDYAVKEYCYLNDKNYNEIRTEIRKLCNDRVTALTEYYGMCDMNFETRVQLKQILDIYKRDLTLAFANVKLGWKIWKLYREIGLDVEKYLELIDLPNYAVIEKKLLAFQKNEIFVQELLEHMKDELPKSYEKYKKQEFIRSMDIDDEEAKRKEYPKEIRNKVETEKMIEECKQEIYKYFPLAKQVSARNILMNPSHPASTGRAFQSSTKNNKEERVNVTIMTPRVLQKYEYLAVLAHETGHSIHRLILEKGENAKAIESGAIEKVPSSVLEDFSQLIEHEFYNDSFLPYKKQFSGKEFPDFSSGLVIRHQVPYSLVQLGIRKEFDKLWDEGIRDDLSEEYIRELMADFDKKTEEWLKTGFNIDYGYINCFRFFSAFNPDDGLVYMKRYITNNKRQAEIPEETNLSMAEAFKKVYGNKWVESKEARIKLLWLLLESGRNYKTETFGDFIVNKSVDECLEELKLLGVNDSEI